MSIQQPFCTPAVEIVGRRKEFTTLEESRPGVDGNVMPPPLPRTGDVPMYSPGDPLNPIAEVMNTRGVVPDSPTVIATDGTQRIIPSNAGRTESTGG